MKYCLDVVQFFQFFYIFVIQFGYLMQMHNIWYIHGDVDNILRGLRKNLRLTTFEIIWW